MAAPPVTPYVTLDAFYATPDLPDGAEFVDGEVVVTSPGSDHSILAAAIYDRVSAFVRAQRLGRAFPDGTGYELSIPGRPDTLRIPDTSFVRAGRVPRGRDRRRAFPLAPDLAVAVWSPSDSRPALERTIADYLDAGVGTLWVADPFARTVDVYAPGAPSRTLGAGDTLDGGAALPGFGLPLDELFSDLDEL